MKIFSAALAVAAVTAALGLPAAAFAQNAPGPDMHQPMTSDQMHHDDMHHDDMHHDDMHHDDMHGDRGDHHGWHRHCWTKWRHHHRVRVCS